MFARRAAWVAFTAGAAALALWTFRAWGPRGSAVLIALWGLAMLGFALRVRWARRRIRERFARIPPHQRAAVLESLGADERAEVLDALKRDRP